MKNATRRLGLAVVVLGLMTGMSGQARAGITVYLDRASFESAMGTPISTEDFTGTTLVSGLSFTSSAGSASIGGGVFNDQLFPGDNTTFSFAPAITAFGANFDLSPGGAGLGLKITTILPGGGTESVSQEIPDTFTGQFFGFISSGTLASVQLTSGTQGGGAETYALDNLTFGGSIAAVPEPSTIALVATALPMGLGFAWKRRRKAVTA